MKRKVAFLAAMALCVSSVPVTFAPYAATVSAAESAFNETNYFVVVGTYKSLDKGEFIQLRYINGDSVDKVAWSSDRTDLSYGDILVAEGDVELTEVYEHKDNPVYAMDSVWYFENDAVLKKVGHCTELMEMRELTVIRKTYDGSGHWSIRLTDENGEEYYHGFSVVGSSLGVNLAYDAEVGDKILFAFDSRKIRIPLEIIKPKVPSWVPKSFEEAMEFYNEYGVTHISKGNNICDVACLVFPESISDSAKYEIRTTESVNNIYHETFTSPIGDTKYEVVAYYDDCKSPTSFSVDLNCNDEIQWSYVFDCDGSGNLTETDLYSWVPDCITEFNEFEEENGKISVQNGYVAFCETSIPGAGYSWTYNQSGEGELAKIINVNCTEQSEVQAVGGAVKNFCLLKPEKDGKVNLNLVLERSFQQDSAMDTIDKTYLISENCTKIEEVSNSLNLPELKQGEARVIITDYDTGELIPEEVFSSMEYFMMGTNIGYKNPNVDGGWMYTGPMFEIKNNPYSCNELAKFIDADLFEVRLASTVDGYYSPDDSPIITKNDNGSLEIEFRLKKYTKGDANGDGTFSVADVVSFNKWLLNSSENTLENWKAADLNDDDQLNSADLALMRREIVKNDSAAKQKITDSDIIELSGKGYDLTWKDLEKFQHGDDIGSGVNVYEFEIENMSDRFSFIVSGLDNEIMSVRLSVVNGRESVDIREGDVSMFFAEHNPPA